LQKFFNVIPAKAGIQVFQGLLDPGCHRGDGFVEFRKRLQGFRDFSIPQFLNPFLRACCFPFNPVNPVEGLFAFAPLFSF